MKFKYYKLTCVLVAVIILTSGCIVTTSESKKLTNGISNDYIGRIIDGKYPVGEVYFYHDDEKSVSCWIITSHGNCSIRGGGISCISDSQFNKMML